MAKSTVLKGIAQAIKQKINTVYTTDEIVECIRQVMKEDRLTLDAAVDVVSNELEAQDTEYEVVFAQ